MSRPDENKNEHPVVHPIPPVYRADSRILILGSFPSVKSRETGFFYGHPQNRFWKVTAAVCGEEVPQTVEEKKAFLLRNHIAVWDVIASCVITGSSDASIRDVVPNPLQDILECADIRQIYCNGATAWKYYRKYQEKQLGTGSGSSSVDESRERRMVCGAAAWRVEPVRRSLTKRRVTG